MSGIGSERETERGRALRWRKRTRRKSFFLIWLRVKNTRRCRRCRSRSVGRQGEPRLLPGRLGRGESQRRRRRGRPDRLRRQRVRRRGKTCWSGIPPPSSALLRAASAVTSQGTPSPSRRRRRLDFSGKFQTKNSSSNRRNRDACLPACLPLPARRNRSAPVARPAVFYVCNPVLGSPIRKVQSEDPTL